MNIILNILQFIDDLQIDLMYSIYSNGTICIWVIIYRDGKNLILFKQNKFTEVKEL